jgi:hypothetical protein
MSSTKEITTPEFTEALRRTAVPGGKVIEMLRAHAEAPARAMTATNLAKAVDYDGFRGVNLQYGKLAAQVRDALDRRVSGGLSILVEFVPRRSQTNEQWVLRMKEPFAAALKRVGWLK